MDAFSVGAVVVISVGTVFGETDTESSVASGDDEGLAADEGATTGSGSMDTTPFQTHSPFQITWS